MSSPDVYLTWLIAAPPERVFAAGLDPELVGNWMTPGGLEARAVIDPRVGGAYHVSHWRNGYMVGGFEAEIVALQPPWLLRWTWGFIGPDRGEGRPRYDSTLTVTFEPVEGGTQLVLAHDRLDGLHQALPWIADNVSPGWELVLANLEQVLQG